MRKPTYSWATVWVPHGIIRVFNTMLYENEFQNPQIFQQTIRLFPEHSTLDAALFNIGSASGQTTKTSKIYPLIYRHLRPNGSMAVHQKVFFSNYRSKVLCSSKKHPLEGATPCKQLEKYETANFTYFPKFHKNLNKIRH
jgi:hypothetical protein